MYLVSSCLAGVRCRYDGNCNVRDEIVELVNEGRALAVCPELLGGLPIPRPACEIRVDDAGGRRVVSRDGLDFTREFLAGAEKTLEIARLIGADKAVLKAKSPSCGCGLIHDGTFSGTLVEGNGLTAELLISKGIEVITENELNKL